jgi:hypothetical protein
MKYLLILIAHNFLMSCGQSSTTHKIDFSVCTVYENEEAQKKCFEILEGVKA